MRRSCPALVLAAFVAVTAQAAREERGTLVLDGVPPASPALIERVRPWLQARAARFRGWLPDGAMLVTTRFAEARQLHRVAAPLGAREQLTFGADDVLVASASPAAGSTGVPFLTATGAGGPPQLWAWRFADRTAQRVPGPAVRGTSFVWSPDGRTVAYAGAAADGVHDDVVAFEPGRAQDARLLVAAGARNWRPLAWSADGAHLLLETAGAQARELWLADAATGGIAVVPLETAPRGIRAARFAPDGRGIYLVAQIEGDFSQLYYLDPVANTMRALTADIPWDIESFAVSPDGRWLAYAANVAGTSRLSVVDQVARSELAPVGLPAGRISDLAFDRDGKRLAMTAESAVQPPDVYVYEPAGNTLTRWTHSELGPLDPAAPVTPELIRFPTWDRVGGSARTLPAWVFRPRTPGPHPVLVRIASGRDEQARPVFDEFSQIAVNVLGYAVVTPNVRGAAGYGRGFAALGDGRSEDAIRDIGSLLVWIGVQRDFDRSRIVLMGESQSAPVALGSLAQYNDRVAGGIVLSGAASWSRIPNARALRRPLLVIHGAQDTVAPVFEAERLVASARGNGAEVWYLGAKDEGHGFRRKANRDAWLTTAAAFLERLNGRAGLSAR
ncbi:MAG: prolyl oligopeptidase family serine peptidase [Steroidobacteraceae bacterium]